MLLWIGFAVLAAGVTAVVLRPLWSGVEAGVELGIVQILLGHSSIGTTAVCTHLTEPTRAGLKTILDKLMTGL